MDRLIRLKTIAVLAGSAFVFCPIGHAQDSSTASATTTSTITTPSDSSLQTAIQSALGAYASNVTVTVNHGIASLSGQLDSNTDYEKAIMLTQAIQGVSDVNADNLTVKGSQSPLSDTYITAKVKGAILKSDIMGKDIPSWSISVETKNGQVYLSGTIASEVQRQNVLTIVRGIKGVTKINDEMTISGTNSPQD